MANATRKVIATFFLDNRLSHFYDLNSRLRRELSLDYYCSMSQTEKEEALIESEYFAKFAKDFAVLSSTMMGKLEQYSLMMESVIEYLEPIIDREVNDHLCDVCAYDDRLRREIFGVER